MKRLKRLSLEDRLEIHELVAGYAAFLDVGDINGLAQLFVVSAVLDLSGIRLQGVEQIRQHFQTELAASGHPDRLHHVDTIWIDCRGWDCVVRSHYFETRCDSAAREPIRLTRGCFADLIVHQRDEWKFAERKFSTAVKTSALAVPAGLRS